MGADISFGGFANFALNYGGKPLLAHRTVLRSLCKGLVRGAVRAFFIFCHCLFLAK